MHQLVLPTPAAQPGSLLSTLLHLAESRYSSADSRNRVRRYRYLLRSLVYARSTRHWLDFLGAHPDLARLCRAMPHLADKWHRHYLRVDFGHEQRLGILHDHYEFVLRTGAGRRLVDAMERELPLVTFTGKHDEQFSLVADADAGRTKEGEIVIKLMEGERRIYTIAGTFVRDQGGVVFAIGCLQGPWGGSNAERVKEVTKAMHALRPREAMLFVAQVIAAAFGAEGISGVGSARHVYRGRRKTRGRIPADYYDQLWQELGGQRRSDGDFELPAVPVVRPIEAYASNKRAEARRRQALKEKIRGGITAFLAG